MSIKTNDILPNYSEKHFREAKATMDLLHETTLEYVQMDNLYDVEGLEKVKRKMTGYLELLGSHYARSKRYKTIGDYLEEQRKELKADTIDLLVEEGKGALSTNQAEKLVYSHKYYKERLAAMLQIKSFFIKVEVMYERYSDTLNNIRQSISLCKKDPNFRLVEDEKEEA